MTTESVNSSDLAAALAALRQELARLSERVAVLEAVRGTGVPPGQPRTGRTPVPPSVAAEGLSEELIVVIGAAIAAFLGKKPRIRQIRLVGATAWAQQGRVTIQASHSLAARHVRNQE
jgi:methylmalonyl-CoA carboxyltransferase 12S subunit